MPRQVFWVTKDAESFVEPYLYFDPGWDQDADEGDSWSCRPAISAAIAISTKDRRILQQTDIYAVESALDGVNFAKDSVQWLRRAKVSVLWAAVEIFKARSRWAQLKVYRRWKNDFFPEISVIKFVGRLCKS